MANNTAIYAVMALGLVGGVSWWYMNNQDKTPVGLVVVKQYEEGHMGYDEDKNEYKYIIVEGTWRADANSLTVESESADRPLRVVFKNNQPIDAEVITMRDWGEPDGRDYEDSEAGQKERMDDYNARLDKVIAWLQEYDIDTSSLEGEKVGESTAQEAESIFGPIMSLQSHFVW